MKINTGVTLRLDAATMFRTDLLISVAVGGGGGFGANGSSAGGNGCC